MKKYKVLTADFKPPFQGGEPYEIGRTYTCDNFDKDIEKFIDQNLIEEVPEPKYTDEDLELNNANN